MSEDIEIINQNTRIEKIKKEEEIRLEKLRLAKEKLEKLVLRKLSLLISRCSVVVRGFSLFFFVFSP